MEISFNHGDFFFLYREPESGLEEDYCAFLHLSIAVKSDLHYETLLSSRILQLNESFQHKLGYLVGNLYSRVGTEDWAPGSCTRKEFASKAREPLKKWVSWLESDVHRTVIERLDGIESPSLADLEEAIRSTKTVQEDRRQRILRALSDVLLKSASNERISKRYLEDCQTTRSSKRSRSDSSGDSRPSYTQTF